MDKYFSKFPTKKFKAGDAILESGQKLDRVYVIKSGMVKTFDINKDGEIKIIMYDQEYECFPLVIAFNKSPKTLYFYEAFYDTEVYVIPKNEYISLISNSKDIAKFTIEHLVDRYLDFASLVDGLTQIKGEQKVLHTLFYLCKRFGKKNSINSDVQITIPVSQMELANLVGMTRETVSHIMNSLKKDHILRYENMNTIQVNIAKLKELTAFE